ncbi:MAG: 7-cyano-7-deazaguanine synthase QueC [Desulfovibrio sp.]|nr:7-cyano-7-deazaguanine synthase QueC [Desulfovibrio sp.]
MDNALVLFSGGQDSTTCLFYALRHYQQVFTMGFAYGQRHAVELECRLAILQEIREHFPLWAERLDRDVVCDLSSLAKLDDNALTSDADIEVQPGALPTTFVPARNLLFLSYAAAFAYARNIDTLIIGVSETDYSGYPDCRSQTMASMEQSLSLALDRPMKIATPLMHLDKAATWQLALELAGEKGVQLLVQKSHTCYAGDHSHFHAWGYGCGQCPSCLLRKKGWEAFRPSH